MPLLLSLAMESSCNQGESADNYTMSQEKSLSDISLWQEEIGLLPISLYPGDGPEKTFVLLNGSKGNFCLDTHGEALGSHTRSLAWSSNVGHYVSILKESVEVQRWDQTKASLERYNIKSVRDNLSRFHEYLEQDSPRQDLSIVSHAIRVFRSLRAVLGDAHDGQAGLKAYLCLLACTTDQVERENLVLENWGLTSTAVEIASLISKDSWVSLQDDLLNGRRAENLELHLTLLLRHAAGQLFQEAHYEATFLAQGQLQLAGFTPSPVSVNKENSSRGIHFTPPALARTLVEEVMEPLTDQMTIFDPACGSGEFLREALRQLELKKQVDNVKIIGWDISEAACGMAKFVLSWEKRNIKVPMEVEIRCIDSLNPNEAWPKDVDKVLMNPPFISWLDMTAQQRGLVTDILYDLKEKRPDISHAFLLKASECLRNGGVLGTILPASFLDGASAAKLREELSQSMSPRLIARLGSQLLFPNALIDAAFYVAQRETKPKTDGIAFWADYRSSTNSAGLRTLRKLRFFHSSSSYPFLGDGFSIYQNPKLGHDGGNWAPRPYDAWMMLNNLKDLPKVKDLFNVRQGVITGYNRAFLLNKEQWINLPKSERAYFRPAVVNQSINAGVLKDFVYVFYPYGKNAFQTEVELEAALPIYFANFLVPVRSILLRRSKINKVQWWNLSRHTTRQVVPTPKLVSTYFGDAGSFAWDKTGDFVVVQGYTWLPKGLKEYEVLPEQVSYAYLAILNSQLFSSLLSATSNHVGGGQWNLSIRFVSNIAMPDLKNDQINPDLFSALAEIGKQIYDGDKVDAKYQEQSVRQAYGLAGDL